MSARLDLGWDHRARCNCWMVIQLFVCHYHDRQGTGGKSRKDSSVVGSITPVCMIISYRVCAPMRTDEVKDEIPRVASNAQHLPSFKAIVGRSECVW